MSLQRRILHACMWKQRSRVAWSCILCPSDGTCVTVHCCAPCGVGARARLCTAPRAHLEGGSGVCSGGRTRVDALHCHCFQKPEALTTPSTPATTVTTCQPPAGMRPWALSWALNSCNLMCINTHIKFVHKAPQVNLLVVGLPSTAPPQRAT